MCSRGHLLVGCVGAMSEVYIKEPATKGAAVLHTTHGDLEIELWATECPKACRNFCQLILEGYYNDSIFHRVIKDFLIQGGDKTGTGDGCESIYGKSYPDEIHPRLKFRYRGMMGVASAGKGTDTNGSQFFIVMGRAPTLDGKHTLFGKVVGQTIYNLVRLTEVEVDKNERPVDPPRVLRAELTWDPFGDLEPRFVPAPLPVKQGNEKHRREAIKNKRVLSFGDDEEDGSEDDAPAFGKARSAHDVLKDPKLLKDAAYPNASASSREAKADAKRPSKVQVSDKKDDASKKRPAPKAEEPEPSSTKAKTGSAAAPPKSARRKAADSDSESGKASEGEANFKAKSSSEDEESSSEEGGGTATDISKKRNEEMLKLKREISSIQKGEAPAPVKAKPKTAWEELLAGFKNRGQQKADKPKDKKGRQAEALKVVKGMKSFSERVRDVGDEKVEDEEIDPEVKARKEQAQEDSLAAIWEEGEEDTGSDWLSGTGLSFKKGEDRDFRKKSKQSKATLEIFDPLAAAGDEEMIERARQRRSAQLKPSLRRSVDLQSWFDGVKQPDPDQTWQFGQKF